MIIITDAGISSYDPNESTLLSEYDRLVKLIGDSNLKNIRINVINGSLRKSAYFILPFNVNKCKKICDDNTIEYKFIPND